MPASGAPQALGPQLSLESALEVSPVGHFPANIYQGERQRAEGLGHRSCRETKGRLQRSGARARGSWRRTRPSSGPGPPGMWESPPWTGARWPGSTGDSSVSCKVPVPPGRGHSGRGSITGPGDAEGVQAISTSTQGPQALMPEVYSDQVTSKPFLALWRKQRPGFVHFQSWISRLLAVSEIRLESCTRQRWGDISGHRVRHQAQDPVHSWESWGSREGLSPHYRLWASSPASTARMAGLD